VLVDRGAAKMVLNGDLNGKSLAKIITDFAADPETVSGMGKEASKLGKPQASKVIVDSCYELLGIN